MGRKCDFIRRAIDAAGIANARVINARSEELASGEGREAYDAVTARAVGRLSTLAELASPLLEEGGVLVAWKGKRDADEERQLANAAEPLAMRPEEIRHVGPYAGSEHRHLHVAAQGRANARRTCPRRPGMAEEAPARLRPTLLVSAANGRRLRDREPEGRRRQDDDRGQRRRLRRRRPAPRPCSSTSIRSATRPSRSAASATCTPPPTTA